MTELVGRQGRTEDAILLDGLRGRRMFDMAVKHCQMRLADELPAKERASLVMELIKTQTTIAIFAASNERQPFWNQIDQTVEQFIQSAPVGSGPPPRTFLVRVQQALAHVAQASLIRQELAAELAPEADRERAIGELRVARKILEDLQFEIKDAIPERRRRQLQDGELTSKELLALTTNVRYQMAVCNLVRAELYQNDATGRASRIDALGQVEEQLIAVGRGVTAGDPLWWNTSITRVNCLRLLERIEEANQVLIEIADYDVPEYLTGQLFEQKLRLAIAARDMKAMRQLIQIVDNAQMQKSPQLDLAKMETVIELALRSNGAADRQLWMSEASKRTKQIERLHGGYWGRRAELVLINSIGVESGVANSNPNSRDPLTSGSPSMTASTELDMLVRVAGEALRKKRYEDALKAFDRAIVMATSEGNASMILTLQVQAGQALESMGNHRDAGQRMIDSAERFPRDRVAAPAHLRGCWNVAQVINAQAGGSEEQGKTKLLFQKSLSRHLATWPDSATADQAAVWLAGQQLNVRQYMEAFETCLKVKPTSDYFAGAVQTATQAADRYLARLSASDQRREVVGFLRAIGELRQTLNRASEQAVRLRLSELHLVLLYGDLTMLGDVSFLKSAAIHPTLGSAAKAPSILTHLFARDAAPNEREDALTAVGRIDDVGTLTTVDRYLGSIGDQVDSDRRRAGQELQLTVADRAIKVLGSKDAEKPQRTVWQIRRAKLLTKLGKHQDAIRQFESLEKEFPRKADVKLMLARAMTEAYIKSDPAKPLRKWRTIAARLRSGSENWYEAKLNVVKLLVASGDDASAKKLLQFMKVTPGWSGSLLADEFDQLMDSLQ